MKGTPLARSIVHQVTFHTVNDLHFVLGSCSVGVGKRLNYTMVCNSQGFMT